MKIVLVVTPGSSKLVVPVRDAVKRVDKTIPVFITSGSTYDWELAISDEIDELLTKESVSSFEQ